MRTIVYPADIYGCGYYRLIHASMHLASEGHDIVIVPPQSNYGLSGDQDSKGNVVRVNIPNGADVMVFQRVTSPKVANALPLIRAQGVAVVVDMDDDLDRIDQRNPAWWNLHPKTMSGHTSISAASACAHATLVTVSTPQLLKRYGSDGIVLPNCIPDVFWSIPRFDSPVFGWGGSMHSHPNDLKVLGNSVARLMRDGHQFRVIGPPDGVRSELGLPWDPDTTQGLEIQRWAHGLSTLGVGVAPLADTDFNRSKCLDSETRVTTGRGIVRVGDIVEGDCVLSDGEIRKVEAVLHDVATPGLKLTFASGAQLRLTAEHRLRCSDLLENGWVQAKDLSVGSAIDMEPERIWTEEIQRAAWPSDGRVSRRTPNRQAFMDAEDVPTVAISKRWGRFLGLYAGDGSASGPAVSISCDGLDQDLIDMICADFEAMGFWPSTQQLRTWGGDLLRRRSVAVSSTHLIRFLRGLGVVELENVKRIVRVPEVIWRSPEGVVSAYLGGLFEADGHVASTGIALTTKHHVFALEVQRLLIGFGIRSSFKEQWNTAIAGSSKRFKSYLLTLNRASADVFAEKIGFLSERKRAALAVVTRKPHSNAYRPMAWRDVIVSIEPCWLQPVDIQVEGEQFCAAGLVSHNSRLKILEKAAVGVPTVFSPRLDYMAVHRETGIGVPAEKPSDWYREVKKLVSDDNYRAEKSAHDREAAWQYRISANAWKWAEAWQEAYRRQRQSSSPLAFR